MRRLPVAAALAAALLALVMAASACGGAAGPVDGPELAPASADLHVLVSGDFDGEAWERAQSLGERAPALRDALHGLVGESGARWDDWKAALGDEIHLVVVNLEYRETVLLTEPRDPDRFRELVEGGERPGVAEELEEGWWAAAEDARAIERLREAREADGPLAEAGSFERLTGELPGDALARVWIRGGPVEDALRDLPGFAFVPPDLRAALACLAGGGESPAAAFAVEAEDEGLRLRGLAEDPQGLPPFEEGETALAERLPAGALAFASGRELGEQVGAVLDCVMQRSERAERRIEGLMRRLGVSLEGELLPLFGGESAIALYEAPAVSPLPVVPVLATEVEDDAEALDVVDRLLRGVQAFGVVRAQPFDLDGTPARRVRLGGEDVAFVAAADGLLALAGSRQALAATLEGADPLADDPAYAAAREASGAPDEAAGVVYADVGRIVAALGAGADEARALRSLYLWGKDEGDTVTFEGLLAID